MQPCTPKYAAVGVSGPALPHFKQLWLEASKQVISKQSVGKCFPWNDKWPFENSRLHDTFLSCVGNQCYLWPLPMKWKSLPWSVSSSLFFVPFLKTEFKSEHHFSRLVLVIYVSLMIMAFTETWCFVKLEFVHCTYFLRKDPPFQSTRAERVPCLSSKIFLRHPSFWVFVCFFHWLSLSFLTLMESYNIS